MGGVVLWQSPSFSISLILKFLRVKKKSNFYLLTKNKVVNYAKQR